MTIVMFGGKRGRLASRRTPSQPWSTGWQHHDVRCIAAGGTGALHKIDDITRKEKDVGLLRQHLKTSVRKLMLGCKWVFQMDIDPKHTSKVVAKWLKVLECPSQSPDLNPLENLWTELKMACVNKEAYKPNSIKPSLSGGMGRNSPNLLWEAYGRLPETFDPS